MLPMPDPRSIDLSRRTLLKIGGITLGGVTLPNLLAGCSIGSPSVEAQGSAGKMLESKTTLPKPFHTTLPIPPVLQPIRSDTTGDYYEITHKIGHAAILPGLLTEVWGYNGIFPGPTLHSRSGRRTIVLHRNELPVPTVVHLHGGRTPASSDGYPTDYIYPVDMSYLNSHMDMGSMDEKMPAGDTTEGSRTDTYPLEQHAATLWYHDHRMDFTGPSVWRGLAGFHIVHDDIEDALPLPQGDRDIPLMIVDRSFAADGSMHYPSLDPTLTNTPGPTKDYMSGVLGDCILVNGAPWPVLEVSDTKYRFRILNASNARRYRLRLDAGAHFIQIGTGQGFLPAPVKHDEIDIAQAERFDVILDFSAHDIGDQITMTNAYGNGGTAQVMRFAVTRHENDQSTVPGKLADLVPLSGAEVTVKREFTFERGGASAPGMTLWTVNGRPFTTGTIAARPKLGATEKWTIKALNVPHPFHIHLAPFQATGVDGNDQPGLYDVGWKDVINLDSGGRGELLIRFDGYRGKYVFHCHNLEHEDMMMMANFEVI
jgi:spore coat protein A, manganese oxidase